MSESGEAAQGALVLRLSVPAVGRLRDIATELAPKIAEYLGIGAADVESVAVGLEGLFGRVAPAGADADVALEFRQLDRELLIDATCQGHRAELRYLLPA
jgi:hypothetical protein